MRKLVAFTNVTLDGYFAGEQGDLSWFKNQADAEFDAFVAGNAKSGGMLLLGRTTYELMKSYWPTPQAMKDAPVVAERMNNLPKIVFSRTLARPSWNNTTLVKGDLAAEVRKLKKSSGPDMAILGSGSIVSQLAQAGLIDEYEIVVNPVIVGRGKPLFSSVKDSLNLKLTMTRAFSNGNVFLCYEPAA